MRIETPILFEAYKKMLTIRTAENTIAADFKENKIFSFYHSSVGQEAVAVGACMALKPGDRVFGNHRSHGHYLAQGGDLYRMFCEIYGKADGCCKGYGGSMHMLDRSVNFMGTTPILGSIVPIALGSAFEQKTRGSKECTLVFVGDGATEEGAFYESLNLAALFKLPIIIVIEDNLYAVNSPSSDGRTQNFNWRSVVEGLGCLFKTVGGNRFDEVFSTVDIYRQFHLENYPIVIHALTHRHMAHSGPITDESVRKYDTVGARNEDDCVARLKQELINRKCYPDDIADTEEWVRIHVEKAYIAAKMAPEPVYEEGKVYVRD